MSFVHLFAAATDLAGTDSSSVRDYVPLALLGAILVCLVFMARNLGELNRRVREMAGPGRRGDASGRSGDARVDVSGVDVIDAATLVVIAAAVYAVMNRPARIVAIQNVEREKALMWSLEGRRQVFQSHHVR